MRTPRAKMIQMLNQLKKAINLHRRRWLRDPDLVRRGLCRG